jgi:uncharacterized protein YigE (DUF2233 family)
MKPTLVCLIAAVNCAHAEWKPAGNSTTRETHPGAAYTTRTFALGGSDREIELHTVVFNSKHYTLRVVDSPKQYGTNLGRAMTDGGFVAGVNGGYFTPEFKPLGLLVIDGTLHNPVVQTKLLSGVLAITSDRIHVLRNREFKLGPKTREALQAGPFLMDDSRATPGLNNVKRAARTFIATDGKTDFALGVMYSPTLAEAGELLATPDAVPGLTIRRALNFDGGRSTGFWVRAEPNPTYNSEISSVRNFVGLVRRSE